MPERLTVKNVNGTWSPTNSGLEDYVTYSPGEPKTEHEARHEILGILESLEETRGKYALYGSIDELREACFAKIDQRTDAIIEAGFTFEGIIFSMSMEAQARYLDMKFDPTGYPLPMPINSKDDRSALVLTTSEHVLAFCAAAKQHMLDAVGSGFVQKQSVRETNDPSVLMAYEDPRPLPADIVREPGTPVVDAAQTMSAPELALQEPAPEEVG